MKLPQFEVNDKTIFWGGAITMYAYPLIAWAMLILFAPKITMAELVFRGSPWYSQIGLGALFGVGSYLVIHAFIFSGWMRELTYQIALISRKINWIQVVFLSLAAGVGEELLFRVGLQHFLGIWPTAIVFVALHNYLSIENEKVFVYGVFMVIVSAGFGYLYQRHGILTAIVAHALVDLLIFIAVKRTPLAYFKPVEEEPKDNQSDFL